MSVLSDASIRAHLDSLSDPRLRVEPLATNAVQPSSLDLHLGESLLRLPYGAIINPEQDQSSLWEPVPTRADGRWWLGQNTLYLGVTAEDIHIPTDLVGMLHGVSSLGRLGLLVHVTAGLADAGFSGRLTLELVSLGGTILLRPGMRIAQLTLHRMTTMAASPYAGRYANDRLPTPSRAWKEAAP